MEDARVIHDHLGQVHAMITDVIKKTKDEDAGRQADRPWDYLFESGCPSRNMRVDVRRSDIYRVGEIGGQGNPC